MSTAANQRRYALPPDFEQFVSDLYFDGVNYQYPPITQLPASRLMQLAAESVTTGTPTRYAIETEAHDGVAEQGSVLVLHPTPDTTYPLIGIYEIGVRMLSDANPYPPGGQAHGELFIAACLAAAERKFLDSPATGKQEEFQAMLQMHIAIDLRRQPRNLGNMALHGRYPLTWRRARRLLDLVSGYTTYEGSTDL
jgi:hypothetical protein